MAAGEGGFDPQTPGRRFDAILLDVDHSPRHVLHAQPRRASTPSTGCAGCRDFLAPGGVFALWSDDPPDDDFLAVLRGVFDDARAEVVAFRNFLIGGESTNTVYVAR